MHPAEPQREAMEQARLQYVEASEEMGRQQRRVIVLHEAFMAAQSAYIAALEKEVHSQEQPLAAKSEGNEWLEPGPDFAQVVRRTASRRAEERLVARRQLEKMGPKAIEPLMRLVQAEGRRRTRRMKAIGGALVLFTLFCFVEILVLYPAGVPHTNIMNWLLLGTTFVLASLTKATLMQRQAAEALAGIKDVRVVGALAEALELGDPTTYRAASSALIGLLPRLRPSDNVYLNERQMECLYRALEGYDYDLVLGILRALEQIGDKAAIPYVTRLAEMNPVTPAQQTVRRAAEQCLPALLDLSVEQRLSGILLRPTTAPAQYEETLLRPVTAASESDPQLLLRPMQTPE